MFAVPGWNLTATLKTQTEGSASAAEKRGKKRKRKEREQQQQQEELKKSIVAGDVNKILHQAQGASKEKHVDLEKKEDATVADGAEVQDNGEQKPEEKKKKKRLRNKRPKISVTDDGDESKVPSTTNTSSSKPAAAASTEILPIPKPAALKLTPLQAAMHAKLSSARFRHLNQTLYTTNSSSSLELFTQNPDMFNDYHTGFAQQVAVWPENPVDRFVEDVLVRGKIGLKQHSKKEKYGGGKKDKRTRDKERAQVEEWGANGLKALPRDHRSGGLCTIADLGCGTASFSTRLQPHTAAPPKGLNLKIHSFDLNAPNSLVTVADIANLPLQDNSVDVSVFCLALMGTNWVDFIDEAWRILHWKGECWISEIKSRFGRVGADKKNKLVGHSIGSLNKNDKKNKKAKKNKAHNDGDEEEDDEAAVPQQQHSKPGVPGYVNDEVDDPDTHSARLEQTDLSSFIDIMHKHGFALEKQPDMSNKMFVKMLFVKSVKPVRGKNVRKEEVGERAPKTGKRFLAAEEDEVPPEEEGKALKPCVYKLR